MSRKCWDTVTPAGAFIAAEGCHDASGGTAVGQIGYRWQSGTWVFGVEGQGNWADFSGGNVSLAFPLTTINSKIDAFGLLTGQIGYAANTVLFYVKGGAAVVADRYRVNSNPGNVLIASSNDDGGVVAGRLERLRPNWSAAIEYNHLFIQDRTVGFNFAGAALPSTSASAKTLISSPSASTIVGVVRLS
nr:hypothetical protein [Bradyrhizobium sp. AUGA SZCCT0240]